MNLREEVKAVAADVRGWFKVVVAKAGHVNDLAMNLSRLADRLESAVAQEPPAPTMDREALGKVAYERCATALPRRPWEELDADWREIYCDMAEAVARAVRPSEGARAKALVELRGLINGAGRALYPESGVGPDAGEVGSLLSLAATVIARASVGQEEHPGYYQELGELRELLAREQRSDEKEPVSTLRRLLAELRQLRAESAAVRAELYDGYQYAEDDGEPSVADDLLRSIQEQAQTKCPTGGKHLYAVELDDHCIETIKRLTARPEQNKDEPRVEAAEYRNRATGERIPYIPPPGELIPCSCIKCGLPAIVDIAWSKRTSADAQPPEVHDDGEPSPGWCEYGAPLDVYGECTQECQCEPSDPPEREGCCMPGRCLCPHVDHDSWECFDAEMAEATQGPDLACELATAARMMISGDGPEVVDDFALAVRRVAREELAKLTRDGSEPKAERRIQSKQQAEVARLEAEESTE
jgi:hypothetical protein